DTALYVLPSVCPQTPRLGENRAGDWPAVVAVSVPPMAKVKKAGKLVSGSPVRELPTVSCTRHWPCIRPACGYDSGLASKPEPRPVVQTPEPACRLEPVLLLQRKLQYASNFSMSYCFLLFVLNIAAAFRLLSRLTSAS